MDQDRLILDSCKDASVGDITTWAKKGIITVQAAIERMGELGWDQADAVRQLESKGVSVSGG